MQVVPVKPCPYFTITIICATQSKHFHVMWPTAQHKTAVICSHIEYSIHDPATHNYDKVFVEGTM